MSPRNDEWSESVPDTLLLIMELQIAVLLALLQKIQQEVLIKKPQ